MKGTSAQQRLKSAYFDIVSHISRRLRDVMKAQLDESHVLQYLTTFKEGIWPNGSLKPASPPRTAEDKIRTREDANKKLSTLMPG